MSDEKRRVFTHPNVAQSGRFRDAYTDDTKYLTCSLCAEPFTSHYGWSCHGWDAYSNDLPTTVSHRCARCGMVFALVGDVTADAIEAGHHERCFVVGDWVRVTIPRGVLGDEQWFEGELLSMAPNVMGGFDGNIFVQAASPERAKHIGTERSLSWGVVNTIRHIQRPGQALNERDGALYCGDIKLTEPAPPAPTLYDGNTLDELLVCDEVQRRGECTPHVRFTPAQRAAISAHWSAELRAKIAAAREHERNKVRMPDDDAWLANCRDVE